MVEDECLTFLNVEATPIGARHGGDAIIFGAAEGTPHIAGAPSHAAGAPRAIRKALQAASKDLERWDFDQDGPLLPRKLRILDGGDLATSFATPEANRKLIAASTSDILETGAVPILLGGDDSVPIPFLQAFQHLGPLTIVQIDAHLDWRDERGGSKFTFSSPMRRASEMPWIERIVQIGLRGIGSSHHADLEAALRWGARLVPASVVHKNGIGCAIDLVPIGSRCVVTLDCDGLDPSVMPGVIVPQPGGLSYFDVIELLKGLASRTTLVGFDLVELVPERDPSGISALTAARLVCMALRCIEWQRYGRQPESTTSPPDASC